MVKSTTFSFLYFSLSPYKSLPSLLLWTLCLPTLIVSPLPSAQVEPWERLWSSFSSQIQGCLSKKMCLQSISVLPICCFWKYCPSNCGRAGVLLWLRAKFSTTTKSHLASFMAESIYSSLAGCQAWVRILLCSGAWGQWSEQDWPWIKQFRLHAFPEKSTSTITLQLESQRTFSLCCKMGCQKLKPTVKTSYFAVSVRDCQKEELLLLKNYGKSRNINFTCLI